MYEVDRHLRTLYRYAKIENASFHTLRRTFASRLAQPGVTLPTVQTLKGHAEIEQTSASAHLAPGAMQTAVCLRV